MIVQQLQEIQHRCGFLPVDELRALAARTGARLYRLQEVASFYPHFRLQEPPRVTVRVCRDVSCQLRGSYNLLHQLQRTADSVGNGELAIQGVSCLGRCDRAPVACVSKIENQIEEEKYYAPVNDQRLSEIVNRAIESGAGPNSGLPRGDADANWRPEQNQKWLIDIYSGQPDLPPYAAVRHFVNHTAGLELKLGDNIVPAGRDVLTEELEYELASPSNLGPPFLDEPDPQRKRIIASLYTAGLLGMGGAGGRAYKKWFEVRQEKGKEKYVVCNADESEPGTFKDREILLRAPHLVVEGVILAGLLVGATRGYIYIRHEYPEQIEVIRREIERAQSLGVCGANLLDSGRDLPVDVFISPGGYICGEQTALIEVLEDKRAEPRNRPPELQTNGLWDKPTLLNNVETLAWVPAIVMQQDGQWFADAGLESFCGRRFFSISGDVAQPGAYEVPNGIRLRDLIDQYAGGMREDQPLKAVALSGPSGGLLPRNLPVEYLREEFVKENLATDDSHFDLLDMKLDIDTSREMGVMLGAGIVVFGESADMVAAAVCCTEFYRNESCGKCVPCRVGSQKLVEILNAISNRKHGIADIYGTENEPGRVRELIRDLADTMRLTAICGLGNVAPNPLSSLLDHFRSDVEKYLNDGK